LNEAGILIVFTWIIIDINCRYTMHGNFWKCNTLSDYFPQIRQYEKLQHPVVMIEICYIS
jgi:hypothetical protein